VLPLSGLALLAGITALVRTLRSGRSRLTFPTAGVAVAGTVVLAALAFPEVLGSTYRGFRERRSTDAAVIRRLPLHGKAGRPGGADSAWADASRTALQQGPVTVQVDEVAVTPLRGVPAPNQEGKGGVYLVVRLSVRLEPRASESAAEPLDDAAALQEKYRPKVWDVAGKVYELLTVQTGDSAEKDRGVSPGVSSRVLVFEAPAASVPGFRLEVPAAAWGGSGAFRFGIPGSMIRRKTGEK
jgi:hypothetical protein